MMTKFFAFAYALTALAQVSFALDPSEEIVKSFKEIEHILRTRLSFLPDPTSSDLSAYQISDQHLAIEKVLQDKEAASLDHTAICGSMSLMLELQETIEGSMDAIVESEVPKPVKQRVTNAVYPFYKSLSAAVEQLTERLGNCPDNEDGKLEELVVHMAETVSIFHLDPCSSNS